HMTDANVGSTLKTPPDVLCVPDGIRPSPWPWYAFPVQDRGDGTEALVLVDVQVEDAADDHGLVFHDGQGVNPTTEIFRPRASADLAAFGAADVQVVVPERDRAVG